MKVVYNKFDDKKLESSFYARAEHLDDSSKRDSFNIYDVMKSLGKDEGELSKKALKIVYSDLDAKRKKENIKTYNGKYSQF